MNRHVSIVAGLSLMSAALFSPVAAFAVVQFEPGCTLPFEEIKGDHPEIASCPAEGTATRPEQEAQNRAKNDLCGGGKPINLTFKSFVDLQKAAEAANISFGGDARIPKDRDQLKGLLLGPNGLRVGEGSVVRYVGFVSNPRYANRSSGESVNCKRGGTELNDIHVDLLQSTSEPACKSVTAEIIPHFRPAAWEVDVLKQFRDHPMRFTGHLFFDASHRPCKSDNDKINPKRVAIWEIHPVYAIDVCKFTSLARCRATNEQAWTPISDLVNTEAEQEE